jgi:uncharacterized protein (DUF58 family)
VVFQLAQYFSDRWAESLKVERTQQRAEYNIGDSIAVGLKLRNDSGLYIPWLFAEDVLPKRAINTPNPALEVTGQPAKLYFLHARQPGLMAYQLRALRRGYFQLGPTILETGDLLGLHRNYRIATEREFIIVLPKLIPLDGMNVTSQRPMGELRANDRMLEDPTQMIGIREYRMGDSLNRIHWRATARTGKLHTRVFQPTCIQGAMIVLDMHCKTNPDRNEPLRTDLAVTAAASIAHTLYMMNQPFGLVSNGRDAADRVRQMSLEREFFDREQVRDGIEMQSVSDRLRPVVLQANRGPEHFAEVHRTLARLERTDGLGLQDLFLETESRFSRQLSVIVILQNVDDESAFALASLKRRGYSVCAVINQHSQDGLSDSAAKLVACHIPVYALPNESSVQNVCREILVAS